MENYEAQTDKYSTEQGCHKANWQQYKASLKNIFRQVVIFICCGPGVLGFLWLIGRILRR